MTRRRALGLAALALATPGLWIARPLFFAAWLAAWWWALGAVLGALANAWIHTLTGGRWGTALQRATDLLARRMPLVLLLSLPLPFGLDALYPWLAAGAQPQTAFRAFWLSPGFFAVRCVACLLAWAWLARRAAARSRARAATALIVHALITSLAAVDLLMSLLPAWYSTVFPMLVLVGQLLAGTAVTVALTARWRGQALRVTPREAPPVGRDLGNLLLTWSLGWAYLAFVQLLIIWAENLPREIAWYLPRLQTPWRWVGIAVAALAFALPLLALLQRAVKDRPERLAVVAAVVAAGSVLDAAWLVLPSVPPASLHGAWLVPLLAAGMALVLFGDAPERLQAPGGRDDDEEWRRVASA